MRGAVPGLPPSALSLAAGIPPSFFGSDLTRELIAAFDEVLAPVITTLDDLDAYLDPRYAPGDYAGWLGTWLSTVVDQRWPTERVRRHLVDLRIALTHRGTVHGLHAALRACTGRDVVLQDNGGVQWNGRPHGALPGQPRPLLEVWVRTDGGTMRSVVDAVIADFVPAHVPYRVHVDGD